MFSLFIIRAACPIDVEPQRSGCQCGAADERAERHLQTLREIAEIGMDRDAGDRGTQTEQAKRRGLQRKNAVRHIVEQAIENETDGTDREDLLYDLHERFEHEDDLGFADRPIAEQVARICRDLGVTPDWSLWADEDWAIEGAQPPRPPPSEKDDAAPGPAMTHDPPRERSSGQRQSISTRLQDLSACSDKAED